MSQILVSFTERASARACVYMLKAQQLEAKSVFSITECFIKDLANLDPLYCSLGTSVNFRYSGLGP